jgi:hypothetical protein
MHVRLSETTIGPAKQEVTKVLEQEQQFKADNASIVEHPSPATAEQPSKQDGSGSSARSVFGTYDIDIFWCEGSGKVAERQAAAIHKALLEKGAAGRIRTRLLPDTINAQQGYGISGYAIRRHGGDEQVAAAPASVSQTVVPGTQFTVELSGQPFRWYLSAFVCPAIQQ